MTQAAAQLDPSSLVARIISELEVNPDAQRMLLHALLSQEFLGVPTRLERIESEVIELTRRLRQVENELVIIKGSLARLDERVERLEVQVGRLSGDNLEFKLPRRVRPILSQRLGLRRARIMQSLLMPESVDELSDPINDAYESGLITFAQESRLEDTDLILRARRRDGDDYVWVSVEASSVVTMRDISRARESAEVLQTVFGEDVVAAVCGYGIRAEDERRAEEIGVAVVIVQPD